MTADLVAPRVYRRLQLARRLTEVYRKASGLCQTRVLVRVRRGGHSERYLVAISRRTDLVSASCHESMVLEHPNEVYFRLGAVLTIVARAPLDDFDAIADISDGEQSGPGLLSFCSRDPHAVLIPDHLFVWNRGYEQYRLLAHSNRANWNARSDRIVWRGSSTGLGAISKDVLCVDDPDLLLRVRLCLRLRDIPGTDVKISAITQSSNASRDTERLARANILGDFISPIAWHTFKFAIDIDGNSNAWSNLFTRLIMGCCVLKVASALDYRQWYYDDLEAWTHYVPVKPDLSDLLDRINWCRANLGECGQIAARGQAVAMARGYEAEIISGARRICDAFESGELRTSIMPLSANARAS